MATLQAMRRLTNSARYFKRLKLDYPTADTTRGSRRFVKAMKQLSVSSVSLVQVERNTRLTCLCT